jgi:hypothetical protein
LDTKESDVTAIKVVSTTGNIYTDSLLSDLAWGVNSLTYSFPTSASYYGAPGTYGTNETATFQAFNGVQQAAVRTILGEYSAVINFTFTEMTETSTQHATIRYAESALPSTAWAYYPDPSQLAGDVWFGSTQHYYDSPVVGSYAWLTTIHETGHTMGLKHPQTAQDVFGVMPADHDSLEYTVMSYRSYIGGPTTGLTNEAYGFPQTLMMLDVSALQELYGANFTTNAGNTVYKWDMLTGQEFVNGVGQPAPAANKIFMNVWDGGGHDTYDFSNYTTNLSVNLGPGGWTTTSSDQLAYLGAWHYAAGNISNSLLYHGNTASLIEDAIGGTGNDAIVGNVADNRLTGGGGNDALDGGSGTDTAVYSGVSTNYQMVHNTDGSWTVTDVRAGSPDGTDTLTNMEMVQFSDTTVSLNSLLTTPTTQVPTVSGFSNDSGAAGDRITNDNTLMFTGVAAAGNTVKVFDGATLIGTVTADAGGAWTFTTSTLADGAHSFTTVGINSTGTSSTASAALTITVDTVAPNVPTVAGFTPDSAVAGDGITNANTITLQGSAEAGSVVKIYDGTTLFGVTTADATGSWTFATANSNAEVPGVPDQDNYVAADGSVLDEASGSYVLADGVHSFKVTATDAAGNTSALSAALTVSIDATAPNAPAVVGFSPDSGVVGDGITNVNRVVVTGTAEAGSTVQVYDGTALLGNATANGSGAWSFATATLADGVHAFTAKSADIAGNISSASTTMNVTVDTAAPNTPTVTAFSPDSAVIGDGITNANVLTLSGGTGAGSTVQIFDGAALLGSATANAGGVWSFVTATLAEGNHTFTAKATDLAGNASAVSSVLSVKVDTLAPSAPAIASFSTDSGVIGDGITNDNTLVLTGTAQANSAVKVFDGATLLGSATTNAGGSWSFATGTLADGAHIFAAKAIDAAGNTSAASTTLNVTIDTSAPGAPTISAYVPESPGGAGSGSVNGVTNANLLTLLGSATAGSTVQIYDGSTLIGSANATSSGSWSLNTSQLLDGAHNFTARSTNAAGNLGVASAPLALMVDTVAPGAPKIVSFSPDSGTVGDGTTSANVLTLSGTSEAFATVKVYDGGALLGLATANAGGNWSFATVTLSNGAHAFTAAATDTAGNVSAISSALTVSVDPNAPTSANHAPVVTASDVTATYNQTFAASSLFSVTDTDNNTMTKYQFWDDTAGAGTGHFVIGGVAQAERQFIDVSAAQLSQTTFQSASGSDDLYVRVFDGLAWSGWAELHVNAPVDHAAVVTASDVTATYNQTFVASSLFSVSDADHDTMTKYQFWDDTADAGSGYFIVNGVAQTALHFVDVSATQLSQTSFQSVSGSDDIYVRTFDGLLWSDWTEFHINAPVNHAPVVVAADMTATNNQIFSAASLFSVSDADHDAMTKYQFWDDTANAGSGYFTVNGVAQTAQHTIDVSAAQLSQTSFHGVSGSDDLFVRSFDGVSWSAWTEFHVTAPVNHTPVVSASDVMAANTQSLAASSLFSVSDADNNTMTEYQFWDDSVASGSGHFTVNGVAQAAQHVVDISAAQLSQTSFVAGSTSDALYVRAFDGMVWSDWKAFNVAPTPAASASTADPSSQIVGTAGDDVLTGTSTNNVLTGGGGSDTFLFAVNFGNNTITDFQATGTGHDVVAFSQTVFNDFAAVLAHATQVGADVVIAADAANTVTLKNVAIANLQSNDVHII